MMQMVGQNTAPLVSCYGAKNTVVYQLDKFGATRLSLLPCVGAVAIFRACCPALAPGNSCVQAVARTESQVLSVNFAT
jgi:hypothetical protein